jgi:cytochrome c biogenesis protein CcmG/thiol:disulfide interchange protein DsbE
MRARVVWLGAVALVLAGHWSGAEAQVIARPSSSAKAIATGIPAPEIDLETLAGGRVRLSALRGRPVVLTFWGTWCPPCKDEFPALVAAHRRHQADGVEILAVNQRDQELNTKDVEAFAKEYGVDFTVALDPKGRSRRTYKLIALPTTIFVDSAGMIRTVHPGPISAKQLAEGIGTILAK